MHFNSYRLLLVLFLLHISHVSLSAESFRSGSYAYRAKIQWKDGNYTAAASLYNNALHEALKEANLASENKIRLNRAHLELDALRLKEAKRWIATLSPNHNSKDVDFQHLILDLKLATQTNNCQNAATKLSQFMQKEKDNEKLNLKVARVHLSMCFSQLGDFKKAQNQIDWAIEEYEGGAPGQIAYARAWIHLHKSEWADAIKQLHTAFDFAQKSMRPYQIGVILYHIGNAYEQLGQKELAKQFYNRSFIVFNKIQILNPMARSLTKYLEYEKDDTLEKDLKLIMGNLSEEEKLHLFQKQSYLK